MCPYGALTAPCFEQRVVVDGKIVSQLCNFAHTVPPSPARPPFLTHCFEQRVVVDGKIVSQLCDENGTLHLAQFQQAMRKQVRRRIAPRCCCSPVPFFGASPLMRFWWL